MPNTHKAVTDERKPARIPYGKEWLAEQLAKRAAVTDAGKAPRDYKTPKSAMVSNGIELTNLSDSIAELIEKNQFAKARTILETDIQQTVETLLAQLETHLA